MFIRSTFLFTIILLAFSACQDPQPIPVEVIGLKPVYIDPQNIEIKSEPPREFNDLGKILFVEPLIFISERLEGIHVIDNTDPSNPERIAFWAIPGNIDFTISDNILYADNSWNLLVIDISNIDQIELLSVLENFYQRPQTDLLYPQDYEGFFECVDEANGLVVEWEESLLTDPKCWR